MEEVFFNQIRKEFIQQDKRIAKGKMMSSEALTYEGKVFAFFSRKKKMVFKLGKSFDPSICDFEISVFNPFKTRSPLNGWFEVSYNYCDQWTNLANEALTKIKTND